jgi:cyclohexanone monooxygenase
MADEGVAVDVADDALGFDPEALWAKYQAERNKRLRSDANSQYVRIEGKFAHYRDDPYVEPGFTRAPLTDEVEVVVIGGGFGGLLVGARLRQAGFETIRMIERGGDFGGTWYWNRYPGAACDVESYVYLPLLEEVGFMPSRKYARAPEILAHSRKIAETFDLYRDACFQTEVTEARWDEASRRWIIRTDRDDAMRARFVVMANGPLDRPKLPGIPGVEGFGGHSFHTSRWDYDYTGGTSEGGLDKLNDKVVGIIGTGATAVQCIPHLAEGARRLYVFQRTPSSIDIRDDRTTDPDWIESLTPGWQERRIENFTTLTSGGFADEDMVRDGWTDIINNIQLLAQRKMALGEPVDDPATLTQLADFKKMEQIRARVDATIQDSAVAEALKPYYNQFCKRPCFHDEYLPAFNRPNVTLVDTEGKGVERITEDGVVVAGREYKVDCLIYATGFEVGINIKERLGYEIFGRDGQTLASKWAKGGASTLHGFQSNGFPNCMILSGTQAGFAINFVHMINEQSKHIAYVLGRARDEAATRFEVTSEAEDEWVAEVLRAAPAREAFLDACTPGYYNYEGDVKAMNARNSPYGGGPIAYVRFLEAWRASGGLPGVDLARD